MNLFGVFPGVKLLLLIICISTAASYYQVKPSKSRFSGFAETYVSSWCWVECLKNSLTENCELVRTWLDRVNIEPESITIQDCKDLDVNEERYISRDISSPLPTFEASTTFITEHYPEPNPDVQESVKTRDSDELASNEMENAEAEDSESFIGGWAIPLLVMFSIGLVVCAFFTVRYIKLRTIVPEARRVVFRRRVSFIPFDKIEDC